MHLTLGPKSTNTQGILKFRDRYLSETSKLSNGKQFTTDKMPQNFRFIPLICAALPEAKIIHVQRNASATAGQIINNTSSQTVLGIVTI